jgi:hypothetical protein
VPTGQQYSTIAAQEQLTSNITNANTTVPVTGTTGFPATPFTVIFDIGQATQEAADVTNVSGNNLTCTRGVDGTSAQAHSNGGTVTHAAIGRDFREARAHMDAAGTGGGTTVHGLQAGSVVVGTTDTQTLTNKTLTGATFNTPSLANPAITGTVTGGATYSGITATNPDITGTVAGGASYTGITATSPAITGTVTGGATYDNMVVANTAVGTIPLHVEAITATTANLSQWDVNGVQQAAVLPAGGFSGQLFAPTGLTGAVSVSRYVGATAGGPPTSGTFNTGDWVMDTEWGNIWTCVSGGTPGTWSASTTASLDVVTLSANQATVTFGSIPQYFNHLILIVTAQTNGAGAADFAQLQATWNSISSGYSLIVSSAAQGGSTQTVATLTAGSSTQIGDVWNGHAATPGSGRIEAKWLNYSEGTFRKNVISQSLASDGGAVGRGATFYGANTTSIAAITTLTLSMSDGSSFITGSKFELLAMG